ncbi:hypothetical protein [Cypionkella sp.]|uniref:hypothetical protein n=1 Tax=Cypionkella sp. TaxID=2811411 RepID=UPI002622BC0E|nr:hypothetical protein [Cypionkella sp.]MDB5665042.1 hypothetical protein [Cypionkella sp.]
MNNSPGIIPKSDRSTTAPNGKTSYGTIPPEVANVLGVPAGDIHLLNGFENSSNSGFGLAHIEAKESRKNTILRLGFRNVEQMIFQACSAYESIHQGVNGRQLLVKAHGAPGSRKVMLEIVIEWNTDRGFWHVITALPTAVVRKPQIWP